MSSNIGKYVTRGVLVATIGGIAAVAELSRKVELRNAEVEDVRVLWYHFPKTETLPNGDIIIKNPVEKDSIPEGIELKVNDVSFPVRFIGADTSLVHRGDKIPSLIYARGLPFNHGKLLMTAPYRIYEVP
jgi:hypothetical protein